MTKCLYNRDYYFKTKLENKIREGTLSYRPRWSDCPQISGGREKLNLLFIYSQISPNVRAYYFPFYIKVKQHKSPINIESLK